MNVIVTGASRGIGKAIAEKFIAQGDTVYAISRHWQDKNRCVQGMHLIDCDITDKNALRNLLAFIKQNKIHIDVLINNAGVVVNRPIGMITQEDIDAMLQVNVAAPILLTQAVVRFMKAGSAVVNIASVTAVKGSAGQCAYSASKGALISFTRSAAKELAAKGIRVNAIAPGLIDTELYRQFCQTSPEAIMSRLSRIALNRPGNPAEIAETAYFLSTPASSYITGQIIAVDGLSDP